MIPLPIAWFAMSNSADFTVLEQLLEQTKAEQDPTANESEFFEFFSAQQVLRDYQLDPEEIKAGIVGQASSNSVGTDGGIGLAPIWWTGGE